MTGNWILSASLLSADFLDLGKQIITLEKAGIDWLHVDIMDGHFTPNISMGPNLVEVCSKVSSLPLDVHLMIKNPESQIEVLAKARAKFITIHIETGYHPYRTLQSIRALGCRPGIALNPGTPNTYLKELIPLVDMVLIMGTNPGFSGQTFISNTLTKITTIREENPHLLIQVDGGINSDTLVSAYNAGANVFVAGNAIFNHPEGIEKGVKALRDVTKII